MTDITIPPEALEAMLDVLRSRLSTVATKLDARAACLAMLKAWPGMQLSCLTVEVPGRKIILPLTEKLND